MLKNIAIYFSDYVLDSHLCNDTVHLCLGLNTTTIFTIFHSAQSLRKSGFFAILVIFAIFVKFVCFLLSPSTNFSWQNNKYNMNILRSFNVLLEMTRAQLELRIFRKLP